MLTLKAQGVLVKGSPAELREELYMTRRATQYIIDALWELDTLPTINQVHQMFYNMLREQGFRAHQVKQIYKYALSLVKSAKKNNGKKPVLKRLAICRRCWFIADRDIVGAMNIYTRALRRMCPSQGSRANAPAMNNETRGRGEP